MPDKDYSKGKIYRIWCISGKSDDVYVGSTIQSLAKRWGGHKTKSRKEKCQHYRLYQTIAGDWDAWKIELIELCPCASKMELERREGEVIRETGTLNTQIAGRTIKEWYQANAEKVAEQQRQYRQQNKEAIAERRRQYKQQNKEAINEKARQYYQQNAEAIAEQQRQYKKDNKEKQNEYQHQYRARKKAEAQAQ